MKRNLSLDVLKLFLSFLIVGLHGQILSDCSYSLHYFFTQGLSRIAVPLFLIISGFYFYEIKSTEKFISWTRRLFILYLLWMIIYSPFWFSPTFKILRPITFGYFHLWYLISSVIAFGVVWAIRDVSLRIKLGMLILCATSGLVLQYYFNYFALEPAYESGYFIKYYVYTYRNSFFFSMPFILIGALIDQYELYRLNLRGLLAAGIVLFVVEVSFNYRFCAKEFDLLVSLYLVCPLVFIFIKNTTFNSDSKALVLLSSGIYLTHVLILNLLSAYLKSQTVLVLITFLISALLSSVLMQLQKRVKFIL